MPTRTRRLANRRNRTFVALAFRQFQTQIAVIRVPCLLPSSRPVEPLGPRAPLCGQPDGLVPLIEQPRHHQLEDVAADSTTLERREDEQGPDVTSSMVRDTEPHDPSLFLVNPTAPTFFEHFEVMPPLSSRRVTQDVLPNRQPNRVHGLDVDCLSQTGRHVGQSAFSHRRDMKDPREQRPCHAANCRLPGVVDRPIEPPREASTRPAIGTRERVIMRRMRAALVLAGTLLVLRAPVYAQLPALETVEAKKEFAELVKLIDIQPGMTAADVGAGSGAWAGALARLVAPNGRVYATEVGTSELAALRKALENGASANVVVVEGTPRETNLPRECCDLILLRRVYHHLTHPQDMANSLVAALKSGGRLAIIDSRPPPSSGPWPSLIGHSIDPDTVRSHFGKALEHLTTVEPWMPPDAYAMLFIKP